MVADFIAAIPLIFPEAAKIMFGLASINADNGYLYVSRIGASLMPAAISVKFTVFSVKSD